MIYSKDNPVFQYVLFNGHMSHDDYRKRWECGRDIDCVDCVMDVECKKLFPNEIAHFSNDLIKEVQRDNPEYFI